MTIYLDNAATSFPKPPCVIEAMSEFFSLIGANSGRSAYKNAQHSSRMVFEARESIGQLIGIKDSSRIIFTSNATEGLNIAIMGILKDGDHVITTSIEHNSVMRPLRFLENTRDVKVDIVPCTSKGTLDPDEVKKRITKETKLIISTSASNVLGTILPIKRIGEIAKEHTIPYLVDGAQTVGTMPVDVEKDRIDLLAFSGHKGLLGPQGTGCLYIREGCKLDFFKLGGTGSESESDLQPEFLPDRFESGTLNLVGIAGLHAAVKHRLNEGIDKTREKEKEITEYLLERLSEIKEVTVFGPRDSNLQIPVVSITTEKRDIGDVGKILDTEFDIAVRCGLQCSPHAHRTMGTFPKGTVRISPGYFNTKEDIDQLIDGFKKILS